MMKKIFSVALVAAVSMIALPSFAQNTPDSKACEKTAECKKSDKKECKEMKMLQGMTLTDAQKQQVKDLNEKTRKQRKESAEAAKAQKKQQKDSAKAAKKEMKAKREASKKEYLKELKSIVGPENYVIFLENQFIMKSDNFGPKQKMGQKQKMNGKHGKSPKMDKSRKNGKMNESARVDKVKKDARKWDKVKTQKSVAKTA